MIRKEEIHVLLLWNWTFIFLFCPIQLPFLEWKNLVLLPFWNSMIYFVFGEHLLIFSDSQGFLFVVLSCLLLALLSFFFARKIILKHSPNASKTLTYFLLASIFLVFMKYGLDKLMMLQFPRPEPNLLFTPLKDFDKDLLFWTSMGTSRLYNTLSGGIEILGALFLLFYRRRRLGLLILLLSTVYIVLLNFSFNIGVKMFSLVLLGTLLTLNWNTLTFLFHFLLGFGEDKRASIPVKIYIPILKSILAISILFYLIELNTQNQFQNELQGIYHQINSPKVESIFINQQNYWIEKEKNEKIRAYQIVQQGEKALHLKSDFGERKIVHFSKKDLHTYLYVDENGNEFEFKKINSEQFPVLKDELTFLVN